MVLLPKHIFLRSCSGFCLLILLISSFLTGQSKRVRFEHFSRKEGLSQVTVNCIYQDRQGFLWIGTLDGLNKFDGYQFTVYYHNPFDEQSLLSNVIHVIFEDSQGRLWVGTDHGLNFLDRVHNRFVSYRHDPNDTRSISKGIVNYIAQDTENYLWLGMGNGAVNRFDPNSETFWRMSDGQEGTTFGVGKTFLEDRSGALWFGSSTGLFLFQDPKDITRFVHYGSSSDPTQSLSHKSVTKLFEDREGKLWIGTQGGLNCFDPKTEKFEQFVHDPNDPHSLSHNWVTSIHQDLTGQLWIGTNGGGLNQFSEKMRSFRHFKQNPNHPDSLTTNVINNIHEDQEGNLWIWGIGLKGLNCLNLVTEKVTSYQYTPRDSASVASNVISAFLEDRSGALWIGTGDAGINKYDFKKAKLTHIDINSDGYTDFTFNRLGWIPYFGEQGTLLYSPSFLGDHRFSELLEQRRTL